MKIIFITPEAVPFSRVGGLGDVSFQLPKSLARRGHQVTVVLPKHRGSDKQELVEIPQWRTEIDMVLSKREARFYKGETGDLHKAVLVGCDELFDRPGLYGTEFGDYDDNAERFIFFSRAALVAAHHLAEAGDCAADGVVVHCHDWTTGLVLMCLKSGTADLPALAEAGLVYTYHNLANQGLFLHYDFALTGLDWGLFTHEGLEFHGQMNLTKAGLMAADIITTVSHTYVKETRTPAFGMGLEGVLCHRQADVFPVQNGVDYDQWDPSCDSYTVANYDQDNLGGKCECRRHLATLFGFSNPELPIVAMTCRLLTRKGLDIIVKALDRMMELPINVAFMGLGEAYYQDFLTDAANHYKGRLNYERANDLAMTHHILAGADIYIMPSRFEPCGLEQLYALRYGTVPVVHSTGGLEDTVVDSVDNPATGTGYKFIEYTPEAFLDVLNKAVTDCGQSEKWFEIMRRGMSKNFSWDIVAANYQNIYEKALSMAKDRARRV